MEIILIIAVAVVFFKIFLPFLFVILKLLWTPVELFLQLLWAAKWYVLAAVVVLLLLSALGVFA